MNRALRKLLWWLFSLAGSILLAAHSVALVRALFSRRLDVRGNGPLLAIVIGAGAGLVVFTVIAQFSGAYVFGHEFTHWLMAKLFLRRTGRFRVASGGGSVEVADPNIWITLAPYFVPIYTVLWVGVIALVRIWYKERWLDTALFGGVGVTYAYHVVLTVRALRHGQSDLHIYGALLSLCLIIALNINIVYWSLAFLTGAPGPCWRAAAAAHVEQARFARRAAADHVRAARRRP